MTMILAGFIGAAIAVVAVAVYAGFARQTEKRGEISIDVVSWIDDIYDRLNTIHAQREATFTGAPFGLSNDEYRQIVKETKALLLATKMHAKVSLVYGPSVQLDKFDTLKEEFVSVAELLLTADQANWPETNREINYKLSNIIEPLMSQTEAVFLRGAKGESVAADIIKHNLPTLSHLTNTDNKNIVISAPGVERSAKVKGGDILFNVIKVAVIGCAVVFLAWYYLIRPDIMNMVKETAAPAPIPVVVPKIVQVPIASKLDLYTPVPVEYGIAGSGENAVLSDGVTLSVDSLDKTLRFGVRNSEQAAAENCVFMVFIPQEVSLVNESSWRSSWQEISSKNGRWFARGIKTDILPSEKLEFAPAIDIRFPKEGDYKLRYKIMSDNLPPKSGSMVFAVRPRFGRR